MKNLIYKEFLSHLTSFKLYPLAIILISLFIFNGIYFSFQFEEIQGYYNRRVTEQQLQKDEASRSYKLPPSTTIFVGSNNEKQQSVSFWIQINNMDLWQNNDEKGNIFLPAVHSLDWIFIIQIFFSLLLLMLSYNSVSEEIEIKTLALVASNAVSRWQIYLSKFISMFLIAATVLLVAMLSSLLFILILNKIPIDGLILSRLFLFYLLSLLYGAFFILAGMTCSVLIRRSTISLIVALSVWLFLVVVFPQGAKIIVQRTQNNPSDFELAQQSQMINDELDPKLDILKEKIESKSHYTEEEKTDAIQQAHEEIKRLDWEHAPKEQQFTFYVYNLKQGRYQEQRHWQQFSPHILFRETAERFLYTGNYKFLDFLRQVKEFSLQFQEDMQRQAGAPKRYYSYFNAMINGERVLVCPPNPKFENNDMQLEATEPPLLSSLAAGLRGLLALMLVVAGVGIWGFVGFVRCDIR